MLFGLLRVVEIVCSAEMLILPGLQHFCEFISTHQGYEEVTDAVTDTPL